MIQENSFGRGAAAKPKSHRDLLVWQRAMDFAVEVYRIAAKFLGKETYGLVSQITRAAASVPANIAEGRGRASRKDFANFLAIAKGSLMESETFIELAVRLGYLPSPEAGPALNLVTEISKMLTKLRSRLLEAKDTDDIPSAA
jgi:four helix bundle protein